MLQKQIRCQIKLKVCSFQQCTNLKKSHFRHVLGFVGVGHNCHCVKSESVNATRGYSISSYESFHQDFLNDFKWKPLFFCVHVLYLKLITWVWIHSNTGKRYICNVSRTSYLYILFFRVKLLNSMLAPFCSTTFYYSQFKGGYLQVRAPIVGFGINWTVPLFSSTC